MSKYSKSPDSSLAEDETSRQFAGALPLKNKQIENKSWDSDEDNDGGDELDGQAPQDPSMDSKAKAYYYGKRKVRHVRKTQRSSFRKPEDDEAPIYPHESEDPPQPAAVDSKPTVGDDKHICDYLMIYLIMGYTTGIFLALLWYLFHLHKASTDLNFKWFVVVLLVLLLLIIFYSRTTRCIGALTLPTLASYRGQALLIAFALFLALTGPVMNIIRNIEILAYSLSCGQTLLRNALTPMHEIMGEPVYVVEQAVYYCLSQVRRIMGSLDDVLQRLEAPIIKMHAAYRSCDVWLQHQQNFFDSQMGSPYDRCLGAGTISKQECEAKFKDKKPPVCNIKDRIEWFCSNLKDLESFYDAHLKEQQAVADQIFQKPLESFANIRAMFEVSITFDHNSKSDDERHPLNNEIDEEISRELDLQMKHFQLIFIWLEIVILALILVIILRSMHYRWNYLGSDNFANYYLTKQFMDYNNKQMVLYGHNDLPLHGIERKKYVKMGSGRMLRVELNNMARSLLFLIITSLQLFTICLVDYSLFWMLAIMSYHSHQTAELQPPEYTKVVIKNGGFIGDVLRGLVQAFEPLSKNLIVDIQRCLPLARPPRYLRYWEIAVLCILAWLLLLWEPYILRLRHWVLDKIYPKNAQRRSMFLHRYLQIDRDTFIKPAKRRARSVNAYFHENSVTKFLTWYRSTIYRIFCGRFGTYKGHRCRICDGSLTKKDYINCDTVGCRGIFCQACFLESNCHCVFCSPRIKYLDFSDISDVGDSSDDPHTEPFRQDNIHCTDRHKNA